MSQGYISIAALTSSSPAANLTAKNKGLLQTTGEMAVPAMLQVTHQPAASGVPLGFGVSSLKLFF